MRDFPAHAGEPASSIPGFVERQDPLTLPVEDELAGRVVIVVLVSLHFQERLQLCR